MTAPELLADLHCRGAVIRLVGDDRLRIEAPRGALTPDLHATLKAHKRQVIEELRRYTAMYEQLTADIGTPEDVEALCWVAYRQSDAILGELLALGQAMCRAGPLGGTRGRISGCCGGVGGRGSRGSSVV